METLLTILAAMVVGASLSISGVVLQGVLRNPLAEPYILGIVGGGALFSALAMKAGLFAFGAWVMQLSSFVGSCFSLLLLMVVAWFAARARAKEGSDPYIRSSGSTVVVAGFVVGGFTGSLDWLVLSYCSPDEFTKLNKWLYGNISNVTLQSLAIGMAVLAMALALLWKIRRELDVMELGHDEAECLGVNTRRVKILAIGAVSLATAVSVSLAGAVGFIGLVVPHFVRRVFGPRMHRLVPLSAAFGAMFLVFAHFVGTALPGNVGVGVVCAIFGAPFFLFLLASRHNGEGRDV